MRREFVSFEQAGNASDAHELCSWAAIAILADGGYWCFESTQDAKTWEDQR